MPARPITQYTDAQLALEILRVEKRDRDAQTVSVAAGEYYAELVAEDQRRTPLRVREAMRLQAHLDVRQSA